MKHLVLSMCVLFLLALTFVQGIAAAAGPVPDKNLEAAIRATLHDTKNAPLTDMDLNNVYVLEAPGKSIKDLTSIELDSIFPGRSMACARLAEEIALSIKSKGQAPSKTP